MFVVSEAEAAAIRAIFHEQGEFSAAVELRRLFPGITDTAQARECADNRQLEAAAQATTPGETASPQGGLTAPPFPARLGAERTRAIRPARGGGPIKGSDKFRSPTLFSPYAPHDPPHRAAAVAVSNSDD